MSRWPVPAALLALLLALAAIAPASGDPWRCGFGSHPDCATAPPSPPNEPDMAVVTMTGFESQSGLVDVNRASPFTGTASYSTSTFRTGAAAIRANPASGASGFVAVADLPGLVAKWFHFGLYVASLPSLARSIAGDPTAAQNVNLALNSDGTLAVRKGTTVIGTSAVALSTGRWYWIGLNGAASAAGVLLQVDAVDQVSGTNGTTPISGALGMSGTEASAIDVYFDDFIIDDAGYLNPSRVGLAVPISDSSRVDWTNDAAGTSNLFDALDNKPPVGIADTTGSTGLHQIRDATNGTDTYVANMTTYASLGIVATDQVIAVWPVAATGAPSATSPKSGSLTVSNPTIGKTSFGQFYNGAAIAGTYPTGWAARSLTLLSAPSGITLANSPVITITQDTSSTRVAMVCALGLQVAWTPGALGNITNVNQAVARAASY